MFQVYCENNLCEIKSIWDKERKRLKDKHSLDNFYCWLTDLNKNPSQFYINEIPNNLRLIGGIDISFNKENQNEACVCVIVYDPQNKKVVKKHHKIVEIKEPYVVNYLAFRECKPMTEVMIELYSDDSKLFPQILLVDGNGTYHSDMFGSACQLGVALQEVDISIPTIGVSKNYLQLDGMPTKNEMKSEMKKQMDKQKKGEFLYPIEDSNTHTVICMARKHECQNTEKDKFGKIAFISPGHFINLNTSVNIVRMVCECRVPEPIRLADQYSKEILDKRNKNNMMS